MDQTNLRLRSLFFRYSNEREGRVREKGARFVYYTTAQTAARILENKEIWMRNVTTMNDFMEAQYGWRCLTAAYNGAPGARLRELLTPHFPDLFSQLQSRFNDWSPHFLTSTYITCVSEHLSSEDRTGRLSMWRAYGAGSGVAIVFNSGPFFADTDALKAYSSPVAYLSEQGFADQFSGVVDGLAANIDFLREQREQEVFSWLFTMMRYAVVSTKHEGFAEELEWRVVHSPKLEPSNRLICSVETIRGIPQRVYKIPLQDAPAENLVGIEIPQLVERIIIGPTQFAYATADAIHLLLEKAGVADAGRKIVISDIPLRTL